MRFLVGSVDAAGCLLARRDARLRARRRRERVDFIEGYASGDNSLRTLHLVICSSSASSVCPWVSTTVR